MGSSDNIIFEGLFEQLIRALHSAEKRHMALRKSASDNDDRETIKHESMTIPRIIKWKDALEALRADILPSGAVSREDVGAVFPTARATTGHPDFTPEHELSRPIDMFPITSYMNPKGISGRDAKRGESYIGKKPTALELLGKKYQVDAWGELYTKVCEVITLHRPYVAALLDKDEEFNTERRTNFSYIQSEIKHNGKRLANGLWIEINQSADDIVRSCRRLLEKCGFSTDELKFDTVGD